MTRKLFLAISLASLSFSSMQVLALGVGEANVKSSLNQPLSAEIELLSVGELTEAEILPALATREEFERAGVDRVYFLSDIRFNVVKNATGKLVVSLSSKKPVRDPYLNFLVEVIWPSGRLLREYSLLIDPPVFTQQVAAPIQSAQVSSAPFVQAPARQSSGQTAAVTAQRAVQGDQLRLNQGSVSNSSSGSLTSGDSYGPTRGDDTLWEVALKARPDRSVSPQQVMLAIQDVNPDAFINGNINRMKEGVVLRMPTREQMTSRSKNEAVNAVIAQNEALRPSRSKSIVSTTQPEGPAAVQVDSGSQAQRDELKLVVANSGNTQTSSAHSGTADAGSGTASKEELALTLEKLDQAVSEKKELSGRVSDLEEQLETLQRLLTLKNDQLAGIQEQMRANAAAEEANAKAAETAPAVPDASVSDVVTSEVDGAATPVTVPTEMPIAGTSAESVSDTGVEASATESTVQDVPAEASLPKPEPKKPELIEPEKQVPKSFTEKLFTDPVYMASASVGILLLMILVWLVSRNNARKEEAMRASILNDHDDLVSDAENESNNLDSDLPADSAGNEEDLSSEVDSRESDSRRSDVIAEADVYIAYGRLDRAAAIIEQAIAEEPLRTDLRIKLLEVYKDAGDKQNFERQFSELEAIRDVAAIALASPMRNELFDRELLSEDSDDFALAEEDFKTGSSISKSLVEEEPVMRLHQSELEREVLDSFDFDQADKLEQSESDHDADFESEIDLDIDLSTEFESDRDESFESDLSLDLDDDSDVESAPNKNVRSLHQFELSDDLVEFDGADSSSEDAIDLDLSDIELSDDLEQEKEIDIPEDLSIPDEMADSRSLKQTAAPVVSDDILQEAEEAFKDVDDLEPGLGEEEEFDFLEGADEASTKLDLARAYIDMGDLDGARDILEEVFKEGNPDQQKEARVLLDELDE